MNANQQIRMTIVYDNHSFKEYLEKDWGFSCFIKGLEKSILFDTGKNGNMLVSNMKKCGISPDAIDLVFLSHDHKDHTGGLDILLNENSNMEVWLPEFFSASLKETIKTEGASVVEVDNFQKICEGAYTTGVILGWIKEQSLILDTDKGLIVVTGCAHPRIVKIVFTAKELLEKGVFMVIGGFHLAGFLEAEIEEIVARFRFLGVEKVGPCHCSGNKYSLIFAKEYQDNFIKIGSGKEIKVP
jgi:7,8-dihydropterin-6-yl-methyl-4-(beta-D-ribofuranosyl)aminobenzene 5'-phosphate synthase